jgi:hypothetical protein
MAMEATLSCYFSIQYQCEFVRFEQNDVLEDLDILCDGRSESLKSTHFLFNTFRKITWQSREILTFVYYN